MNDARGYKIWKKFQAKFISVETIHVPLALNNVSLEMRTNGLNVLIYCSTFNCDSI